MATNLELQQDHPAEFLSVPSDIVPKLVETSGEVFPGGSCIELLKDTSDGGFALLVSDGLHCKITRRAEYERSIYLPPNADASLASSLVLPTECLDYGSTAAL